MVTALVLAAGESLRMASGNKLLLPFQGKPLVGHVVDNVLASEAREVIVILGHEAGNVQNALKKRNVRFVVNPAFHKGMTSSIHAGVVAAAEGTDGFMICLSDQPFIKPEEFTYLIRAFESAIAQTPKEMVVPVCHGRRGNPVIFSSKFKSDILEHKGLKGCKGILNEHPDSVLEVEMAGDSVLRDIDTIEDYRKI